VGSAAPKLSTQVSRLTHMKQLSILIADDQVLVRKGLRALLGAKPEWAVAGEANNGLEAIEKALILQPNLIIVDISMPQLNGLGAIPRMLQAAPHARVLVLTMHNAEEVIQRALQVGASGYVLKSDAEESLLEAVSAVATGRRFVTPSVAPTVLSRVRVPGTTRKHNRSLDFAHPTGREQEVIQLLSEGNSNKQVAALLGISIRTAENHRARLMKKLGLNSLSDLVRYAIRNNIIRA
jgi:two-component system response regulator NreC